MRLPTICSASLAAAALVLSACGGGSSSTTPTVVPEVPPTRSAATPSGAALLRERPTDRFDTTVFRPALRLRLPADWTPDERDEGAFQIYAGPDERKSPIELTFDDTLAHRSLRAAARSLHTTPGLRAGHVRPVAVGRLSGLGFDAVKVGSVRFRGGYHTRPPGRLRVRVFHAGGRTVTLLEETIGRLDRPSLAAAGRVLRTLEVQR